MRTFVTMTSRVAAVVTAAVAITGSLDAPTFQSHDRVELSALRGLQLIDLTCVYTEDRFRVPDRLRIETRWSGRADYRRLVRELSENCSHISVLNETV